MSNFLKIRRLLVCAKTHTGIGAHEVSVWTGQPKLRESPVRYASGLLQAIMMYSQAERGNFDKAAYAQTLRGNRTPVFRLEGERCIHSAIRVLKSNSPLPLWSYHSGRGLYRMVPTYRHVAGFRTL